jgi:hypothetical protein
MTTFIYTFVILFCQPAFQLLFHGETRVIASDNNFHFPKVQFLLSTFLFFGLLIAVENLAKVYLLQEDLVMVILSSPTNQIYFLVFVHITFQLLAPLSTPPHIKYLFMPSLYVQLFINHLSSMKTKSLTSLKLVNNHYQIVNYENYKRHLNFLPTI